ncbi:hypothetical protein EL18_00322 [Nitratireductor basaltis]|uniref:Uncharacterized protein n=1 Tax=Nitratireductor basaltis TaxID=472175 RepID=A0A084U8M1_9HYPH|nr:hypothetical protein EL18_00322 [Nitratireductor basaltis]
MKSGFPVVLEPVYWISKLDLEPRREQKPSSFNKILRSRLVEA